MLLAIPLQFTAVPSRIAKYCIAGPTTWASAGEGV
jgi:hypothetical protein